MGAPSPFNVLSLIVFIFLCLWTGIALFGAINPYYLWKVTQSWKVHREPQKSYFIMQRILSGLFALIGLSLLLLPYLLR